jgi:hypothetical protein
VKVGEVFDATCVPSNLDKQAFSHSFVTELDAWHAALSARPEAIVIRNAAVEYQFGLLLLITGHYRYAFTGLRATLELVLTAIDHSAHLIHHRDWLRGARDIRWAALVEAERGPLSIQFCDAFFSELRDEIGHINTLARSAYRQCSEYVHSNPSNALQLPDMLTYSEQAFTQWHELAETVRYVTRFIFAMRYLQELPADQLSTIERYATEHLSHLEPIRSYLALQRK